MLLLAPAVSAGGAGTSGATFLVIKPMARPAAMGNAYTGLAQGIEALNYNPAGIISVDKWDIGLSEIVYPLGVHYSYAAVARRFSAQGVGAVHLTYLGASDVSRGATGQVTGEFTNYDVAGGVSIGYQIAPEIALGGTLRVIRSQLSTFQATAVGADIGAKYAPSGWEGLTFGAAIQNIGTAVEFISTASPQPLTARLGVAWQPPEGRYTLASDVSLDREAQPRANIGGEFRVIPSLALRGGFDVGYDAGFTRALKLGMGFLSKVGSFDYAFESFGPTGVVHRFSYSYLGGQPHEIARDTSGFFAGATHLPRGRVRIALMPFVNLSPAMEYDWLSEGFKEIFASRLARQQGLVLTDRNSASYIIEGRYSVISAESIWIGIKIINPVDGTAVAFRDATVQQDDLIGGTTTLAGAVAAVIPNR